jgi:hypothetical protein
VRWRDIRGRFGLGRLGWLAGYEILGIGFAKEGFHVILLRRALSDSDEDT